MTKHPRSPARPGAQPQDPLYPSDLIPLPEVRETSSDTSWELWHDLNARQDLIFADTAPASIPMPLPVGDRRYAKTVPGSLPAPVPKPGQQTAAGRQGASMTEVMTEVRRNNRLCPLPEPWQHLYDLLPRKEAGARGASQPPAPLTGRAWASTPSLAKRMCLRDHIEWAQAHGALEAVYAFMKALPEDQWHHMGD